MGPKYAERFASATDLIEEYLDTRLPDEREHYTTAVALTVARTVIITKSKKAPA